MSCHLHQPEGQDITIVAYNTYDNLTEVVRAIRAISFNIFWCTINSKIPGKGKSTQQISVNDENKSEVPKEEIKNI